MVQYQFLSWKNSVVPESTNALISLIDVVLPRSNERTTIDSPILVHCSGGGDRSSVFVSFASLVQQLLVEERVDIFETARYLRSQRQCMLKTIVSTFLLLLTPLNFHLLQAQYDFLYRCLIDYVVAHQISNNSDTQL